MTLLNKIQQELKAPKGQYNSFGNYKYRSCEDIVEAVKPLLGNGTLVINDEIVMLGDRFYVKATAILTEVTDRTVISPMSGESANTKETIIVSATAYAREPLEKKGMDTAQITGATSSYARKYALNGLFAIDDTKDADSHDNTGSESVKMPSQSVPSPKDVESIEDGKNIHETEDVPFGSAPKTISPKIRR